MKHTIKICATLLLVLAMVLSVGMMIACGNGNGDDPAVENTAAERGSVEESGSCRDGLTWTVYENGELVLSGNCTDGQMFDYITATVTPPWKAHAAKITGLTLDKSIKTISQDAFSSMKNLVWVDFGAVENIGANAFRSCSNLRRVVFPGTVKSVGANAFDGCYRMYEARMTDSVTQIGASAFAGCTNLVSINFPAKVQVGDGAFTDDFKLMEIITTNPNVVADANAEADDLGGVGRYAASSGVHNGLLDGAAYSILDYTDDGFIMNGTTIVGYKGNEKNIVLPSETKQIYKYAFYGNTSITKIALDGQIAKIGEKALANCTSLTELTIGTAVNAIETGAFSGCTSVKTINYNSTKFRTTGTPVDNIFAGLTSLTQINFASGATLPVGEGLFRDCTALESVTLPAVANIPAGMFEGCTALKSVTFNAKNKVIGDRAFKNCSLLATPDLTTLASGATISEYAFEGCSSIITIDLTKVSRVEKGAFNYCTDLTGVVIGGTFNTTTGASSFDGCVKLVDVVNNSTKVIKPGDNGNGAVAKYTTFEIGKGKSRLKDVNGFLFLETSDKNYLVGYIGTTAELTLPANYAGSSYEIYKNAFANNKKITSIVLGSGVSAIGEEAFRKCTNLVRVDFTGSSVTVIPDYAFDGCTKLASLTLSEGINAIGEAAFRNTANLGDVDLKNVSVLAIRAFQYSGITKLTAGTGLTAIPNDAFSGCKRLTQISLPSVVTIGNQAFANCESMVQMSIPMTTDIGEYAFYRNISLAKVELPACVNIGQGGFQECGGIMSLTLGENMSVISESAFKDCGKLVYIVNKSKMELNINEMGPGYVTRNAETIVENADESLKSEGDYSYMVVDGKTYLIAYTGTATEITLPATLGGNSYDIYRFAFWGSHVTKVTVSEGVSVIGVSAFAYSAVEHIELPASLRTIHDSAFEGSALRSINIKAGVKTIGFACFKYCYELREVIFPETVTEIGMSIFRDCKSLRNVGLSKNISKIPDFAFDGCVSLKRIVIENSNMKFGRRWYWGCSGLVEVVKVDGGLGSTLTLNDRKETILVTSSLRGSKVFEDTDGFLFYSNNGINYLIGYNGTEKDLVLPANCKGASYQIFDYAFYNRDDIETVRFSDRVTGVGKYAFAECDNLKGVFLPTTLKNEFGVRENIFWGCSRDLVVATGFASEEALPDTWRVKKWVTNDEGVLEEIATVEFNVQGECSRYNVVYGTTYDLFVTMLK